MSRRSIGISLAILPFVVFLLTFLLAREALSLFAWTDASRHLMGYVPFRFGHEAGYHPLLIHLVLVSAGMPFCAGTAWLILRRRETLNLPGASSVPSAAARLWAAIIVTDSHPIHLREYAVPIRDLPNELDGLRVVHLSDTHFGPYVSVAYLERAVEKANRLHPDLIVLTGDYLEGSRRFAPEPGIHVLGRLRARLGVFAVLGNHDHWEGSARCRVMFQRAGLPLLDNRRFYVTADGPTAHSQPGRSLCVAGLGDLWEDEASFEDAIGGVPQDVPA